MISLRHVLYRMERGEQFCISFVKADRRKRTGGEIVEIKRGILSGLKEKKNARTAHFKVVNEAKEEALRKNPEHWKNSTRNIVSFDSVKTGEIIKIHIRLILTYNGETVIW